MKKNIKVLITALAITMTAGVFAGCGNTDNGTTTEDNTNKTEISGSITAAGSTALQPLAEQAAKKFGEKNTNATVTVQGGGSGTGLTQVMQGAIDIGNSDIFAEEKLKEAEAKELVDHKVAVVGFGIVVNDKVNIDNLSKAEAIKIFTGEVTNWNQVGGNDLKITVINRPKSSGTRATFKKYALDGKDEVEGKALTQDSSGSVKKTIEETEGAVGYLATSFINDKTNLGGVKVLKFDGVELTNENITSGKYTIWSYEHMYTKGEPKDLTKAFLDYMVSDEVKPIITQLGYIPVTDMKVTRYNA